MRKPYKDGNSFTGQIMALADKGGISQSEIARRLGCCPATVSLALKRAEARAFKVAALPADKRIWLEREALKSRVSSAEMARAMLLDAVAAAMDEQEAKRGRT